MTPPQPPPPATRGAEYFDQWYADLLASPARNAIVARTLGLPPGMLSTGSLTWPGVAEVTEALRLPPDGLMCLDSVQFASPPLAGLHEFRRVLAAGGRLVLTGWEAVEPSDERVGPRIRAMNLGRDLPAAGFTDVRVQDRTDWREAELRMWQEFMATPAADDDAGLRSMQSEGERSLANWDAMRRVFATATAP